MRKIAVLALLFAAAVSFLCGCDAGRDDLHVSDRSNRRTISFNSCKVGDTVELGRYPRLADGTEKPIKWKVIDIRDGRALLFCDCAVDFKPFQNNDTGETVTWKNSFIRKWLNNYFYNKAFNSDEKKAIIASLNSDPENLEYDVSGGEDTDDLIFCLSLDEAEACFRDADDRKRKTTAYAKANGVFVNPETECSPYWLRSSNKDCAALIAGSGKGYDSYGLRNIFTSFAVCPACYVKASDTQEEFSRPHASVFSDSLLAEIRNHIKNQEASFSMIDTSEESNRYYNELAEHKDDLRKLAEAGDSGAQFAMGFMSDDPDENYEWFRKAADKNNSSAILALGMRYFSSDDTDQAIKYYRKAADLGNPGAQCLLGNLYFDPNLGRIYGVRTDRSEGKRLLELSAAQGCKMAKGILAQFEDSDELIRTGGE